MREKRREKKDCEEKEKKEKDDEVENEKNLFLWRKTEREKKEETEREKETGNAATKDNNCSAGDNVNFCAGGQCYRRRLCGASRDKTLPGFTRGSTGPQRARSPSLPTLALH